ncbi:MAG: malate/lactate/ureidoglycolate dehydrogenase [Rhodospirillales bacterium]
MTTLLAAPAALSDAIAAILDADGCSEAEARAVADHLVEANLCGHDSHGVIRTQHYHEWLQTGRIRARRDLAVLRDSGPLLHLDGQDGLGQWLARRATALGIERARREGLALVALRRAGHIGRVGAYAEQACAAGLISLFFVNVAGSRLVAPFGSASRCISTAPVTIGVPNPDGGDFILDFATSLVAEGKALVAAQGGKAIPDNALIDGEGRVTGDPRVLYGETLGTPVPNPRGGAGALRTMGEHKGSGLALACELLGGALTGNGTNAGEDRPFGNGIFAIFVDPAPLGGGGGFAAQVADYVDFVRGSTPAEGVQSVLIPGDKERRLKAERQRDGLPLAAGVLDAIVVLGQTLALPISRAGLLMPGAS